MRAYLLFTNISGIFILLVFTHVFLRDLIDVTKRMIGHVRRKYDGSFYKDDRSELLTLVLIILLLVNNLSGICIMTYKLMVGF